MPYLNDCTIMGHAGRDAERVKSGADVAKFSVAVNRRRKNADGEWGDETLWFNITVFGKEAERAIEHVKKGGLVMVSGEVSVSQWTNRDGDRQASLELTARRMLTFDKRPAQNNDGAESQAKKPYNLYPEATEPDNDDIPF